MRVIEVIESAMKHNELLSKWIKGGIWFQNPEITDEQKKQQEPRYKELTENLIDNITILENLGITFNDCESIECIEIPEQMKRKEIEIWLESWSKFNKNTKDGV